MSELDDIMGEIKIQIIQKLTGKLLPDPYSFTTPRVAQSMQFR